LAVIESKLDKLHENY